MEITTANFDGEFPRVCQAIREASFIAIDMEMTGLYAGNSLKPSLFDSLQQRYEKQRESVSKFFACQFGLTTFRRDPFVNKYVAKTFTFYLCPRSFAETRCRLFTVDASSLEFLCDFSMDLNKVFTKGISFLNEVEEETLRKDIADGVFKDVSSQMKDEYTYVYNKIESRLPTLNEKSKETTFKVDYHPSINCFVNYLFVQKLRDNFKNVWIEAVDNDIVVTRLEPEELEQRKTGIYYEYEAAVDYLRGFTRVFECMVECRKPMVGYNMMLDILFLYNQFYRPLPKKLSVFKQNFLDLFPETYDAKSIILNAKKYFPEFSDVFRARSLGDSYENFSNKDFLSSFLYQPYIECEFGDPECRLHNAGFDSYASGYVFLRVAHSIALKDEGIIKNSPTWSTHQKAVAEYRNHINLIRANMHFLDLEGDVKASDRPKLLIVSRRDESQPVCVSSVSSLVSVHGLVDVRPFGTHRCLVATGHHKVASDIIKAIRSGDEYAVQFYNPFKHNNKVRAVLWSSEVICVAFVCYIGFKLLKS